MSDVAQTLALIILAQQYRGDVVRQINRKSATLRLLSIRRGAGQNCAWATEADGAVAENYADGADAANFGSDAQTSAILQWGQYRSNFHVSGLAMAAAGSSPTPVGNMGLWARNLRNAASKLATTLNAAIHTGAGTGTTIAGFGAALGSASNTYAGIDRSQAGNAYFRPIISDPGSLTIPTFASIRAHQGAIYDACGEIPDLAFCPTAVFNTIGSLFDGNKVYTVDTVTTARGEIKLEGGYKGIEFEGTVFIKDKDAAVNKIAFVNTNHTYIEYLPPAIAGLDDILREMVTPDDGFGVLPLGLVYEKLGKLGDSDKAQVKAYMQLVCDRPNSGGMMLNVGTVS